MQEFNCDLWLMDIRAYRRWAASGDVYLAMAREAKQHAATRAAMEASDVAARAATAAKPGQKQIALIRVHGPLMTRSSDFTEYFDIPTYEKIGAQYTAAVRDDTISHIIFDIASPGGMAYGCESLANLIYEGRAVKPSIAICDPAALSGGYWLAAAATRVVVIPGGDLGSVGVVAEHVDYSRALDAEGTKVTVIRSSASPYKQEGNPAEPLTDEGRMAIQQRVDEIYTTFSASLAKFRGVSVDYVNEKFGKGRLVSAENAKQARMADHIDTHAGVIQKLIDGRIRLGTTSVQDCWGGPTIREKLMCQAERLKNAAAEAT